MSIGTTWITTAALKVIEVMLATKRPLSELRRALRKFPQVTAALKVSEKKPLEALPRLKAEISALETELANTASRLVTMTARSAVMRVDFIVLTPS